MSGAAGPDSDDDVPIEPPKKILKTGMGGSSILDLQNELLKRKKEAAARASKAPSSAKGILYVKNDEKERLRREKEERRNRISAHELAMLKEAEEKIALANKKLQEKAAIYDKLTREGVRLGNDDNDLGLADSLIDFNAKKREREEERARKHYQNSNRDEEDDEEEPPEVVHYNPNEDQRVYGASHIRFSRNEEKRQKEMADVIKMTEQTLKEKSKHREAEKLQEAQDRARANSLRAILGQPRIPTPEPSPEPPEVDPAIEGIPLPSAPVQQEERPKKEREWDRGKGSMQNWVRQRREDREDEFAPNY